MLAIQEVSPFRQLNMEFMTSINKTSDVIQIWKCHISIFFIFSKKYTYFQPLKYVHIYFMLLRNIICLVTLICNNRRKYN